MAATTELTSSLTLDFMGNSFKNVLLEIFAELEPNFGGIVLGPLSELYMMTCSIRLLLTNGLKVNVI